jgi:hypothetical protein
LANDSSRAVKHEPHHRKVEGWSLAKATGTKNIGKNKTLIQQLFLISISGKSL